jgi:hypothetical protein
MLGIGSAQGHKIASVRQISGQHFRFGLPLYGLGAMADCWGVDLHQRIHAGEDLVQSGAGLHASTPKSFLIATRSAPVVRSE